MPLNVIGVTGSVGTGKSTFSKMLALAWSAEYLSTDEIAACLLRDSLEVLAEIRDSFGDQPLGPDGAIDRRALRQIIFEDDSARVRLGEILHPRIRSQWQESATRCRSFADRLVIEIPLLFENRATDALDRTVCVRCSESLQIERLVSGRNLETNLAKRMIRSQWQLDEKVKSADHVVDNGGSLAHLSNQADLLAEFFFSLDD